MAVSRIDRRTFLTGAGVAAAGLAGGGWTAAGAADRPNVLVIIVDEMRAPQWFPSTAELDAALPNIARIRRRAVSFTQHYTAANMCTPSRGAMLTGLYPHQTGCLLTSQSTLSPGFPTWGSMLRRWGYQTSWYGKWHLGPVSDKRPGGLEAYGFDGGTYPSPNGSLNQGVRADPGIADQFIDWFHRRVDTEPWCTTVSFVNPHDIAAWPEAATEELRNPVPYRFSAPPPNFETRERVRLTKPGLQLALMDGHAALHQGPVDHDAPAQWARMLDLYLWLQQQVDVQIGRVLDTLESRPDVAANTIVVFTADHGDYVGSHGLHGKGGGAYDEALRVPLYISDPRGVHRGGERGQFSSSVDLTPFLLTVATGGNGWRSRAEYAHLAGRGDIAGICANPAAPGRPWIAHVTDEAGVEEYATLFDPETPGHVVALRTAAAKLVVYSHWRDGTLTVDPSRPQEVELYDYATDRGRMELDNLADRGRPYQPLRRLMDGHVVPAEISAPLPLALRPSQEQGHADYQANNTLRDRLTVAIPTM